MLEYIISLFLKIIIEKFTAFSLKTIKEQMLKRGINIKAEKNLEVIASGDNALTDGDVQGWLNELNNEE